MTIKEIPNKCVCCKTPKKYLDENELCIFCVHGYGGSYTKKAKVNEEPLQNNKKKQNEKHTDLDPSYAPINQKGNIYKL